MKLQNQKLRREMHPIRFITLTFSLVVSPFAWLYGTQTFPTRTIACPSTSGLSSSLSYHLASSLLWNYRMGNSWLRLIAYWNILGSSMIWGPRIPSKTPSLTHSPNTQSKTCTSKLLQKCSVKNYIMIVNLSLSKWLINVFRSGLKDLVKHYQRMAASSAVIPLRFMISLSLVSLPISFGIQMLKIKPCGTRSGNATLPSASKNITMTSAKLWKSI